MRFVYRLLNENDDPEDGLSAKDPTADMDVEHHVAYGSKTGHESQFISTSASYDAVCGFARHSNNTYIRIVQIDLWQLEADGDVEVIDLTDDGIRDEYIFHQRAENFAVKSEEVLLVGYVPSSCIKLLYDGPKDSMPVSEFDTDSSSDGNSSEGESSDFYDDFFD